MERRLPLGVQSFEKLREKNLIYVDKTEYVYQLVHDTAPFFLSRPRRFGKSLLLSTFKAYWEGKKGLFKGLAIQKLEEGNPDAWKPYPVFYFDFNGESYDDTSIEEVLDQHLSDWEEIYGKKYQKRTLGYRFEKLLEMAANQSGLRCVVLVDEYDKPLLEAVENKELGQHIKKVFKGFFSRLKKADDYIQFIFITGVTKFHKVSIFSDLNQLNDISLSEDFSALCGITEEEVIKNFSPEIENVVKRRDMRFDECLAELRKQYDGYHFYPETTGVYNPFSLLKSLYEKDFGSYWFETGTPTFLVKKLKKSAFDLRKFTDQTLYASESVLKDYTGDNLEPVPLLYQTGYLTIVDYDRKAREYTLAFPNEEVKYGFVESLMPEYVSDCGAGSGNDIFTLRRYIEKGQLEDVKKVLTSLFASITYTREANPFEHYFQTVIWLVFTLLKKFAECEMQTYTGRIDCRILTRDYIYLFEFKRDDTAENALAQIDTKDYALPFAADSRKLYKIGVSFDSASRKLVGWEIAE